MFARHSLVWLSASGWQEAAAAVPAEQRPAIDTWRKQDWPAIARRYEPEHAEDIAYLGIALPPDPATGYKCRIPLRIAASGVRTASAPLPLRELIPHVPDHWRDHLQKLAARAAQEELAFHVYGSAALQGITGQPYLTAASDIDLLFAPASPECLAAGLALLSEFSRILPLDGEIIFPGEQAVAWREWQQATTANAQARVLVKNRRSVFLASIDSLLNSLEHQPCTV